MVVIANLLVSASVFTPSTFSALLSYLLVSDRLGILFCDLSCPGPLFVQSSIVDSNLFDNCSAMVSFQYSNVAKVTFSRLPNLRGPKQ